MNISNHEKQQVWLFTLLRISFGIIYAWYGMLKFFPGLSPAEDLARLTIHNLTFGLVPDHTALMLLATWEVLIGLLFLTKRFMRFAITIALVHMVCTFLPFLFLPELTFAHLPYGFTLVGQYIVKNIVFIVALMMMRLQLVAE